MSILESDGDRAFDAGADGTIPALRAWLALLDCYNASLRV